MRKPLTLALCSVVVFVSAPVLVIAGACDSCQECSGDPVFVQRDQRHRAAGHTVSMSPRVAMAGRLAVERRTGHEGNAKNGSAGTVGRFRLLAREECEQTLGGQAWGELCPAQEHWTQLCPYNQDHCLWKSQEACENFACYYCQYGLMPYGACLPWPDRPDATCIDNAGPATCGRGMEAQCRWNPDFVPPDPEEPPGACECPTEQLEITDEFCTRSCVQCFKTELA